MPVSNSPRAYGRVRNPLLKKENKNYKKLQERKFTKTKAKEIWCPSPNAPWRPQRPQERNISYQDMMLPKLKKVMVQCFVTEEKRRLDSWLCIIVSLPRKQVKSRQRRKGSKTVSSQEKPLFAAEKEWRSTGIVLGLLVSMTKMVLFASLLVGMLRFNYKGRKYQDSFPKEDFPQRLENTSCWIISAEDYYPIPWCLSTKPKKQYDSPCGYSLLKKGSDEKVKIEGKICSERAAKAMEKKTVYKKK